MLLCSPLNCTTYAMAYKIVPSQYCSIHCHVCKYALCALTHVLFMWIERRRSSTDWLINILNPLSKYFVDLVWWYERQIDSLTQSIVNPPSFYINFSNHHLCSMLSSYRFDALAYSAWGQNNNGFNSFHFNAMRLISWTW